MSSGVRFALFQHTTIAKSLMRYDSYDWNWHCHVPNLEEPCFDHHNFTAHAKSKLQFARMKWNWEPRPCLMVRAEVAPLPVAMWNTNRAKSFSWILFSIITSLWQARLQSCFTLQFRKSMYLKVVCFCVIVSAWLGQSLEAGAPGKKTWKHTSLHTVWHNMIAIVQPGNKKTNRLVLAFIACQERPPFLRRFPGS